MAIELPQNRLNVRQTKTTKRNVPLEQIIAVEGYNPIAQGIEVSGNVIGQTLQRRAELQRQGQELAQLESLAGRRQGEFANLSPDTARTFASADMKSRTDIQEEGRKQAQQILQIRSMEKQFQKKLGYEEGELGDNLPAALLKVQSDLGELKQQNSQSELNRELRERQFDDRQLTSYSKQLQQTNIPSAISTAQTVLAQLPEKGKDIPGYGPLAGALPNFALTEEGKRMRQGIAQLFNIELKTRSGVAVTDPELERLKIEFGQGTWFTNENQLRTGLRQYIDRLSEIARNVDAGFDSRIKDKYSEEGGLDINSSIGQMKALKKIQAPSLKALPDGIDMGGGFILKEKKK